ncbi:hypothetical protein [Nodularia sphaerocarpa]|uniref:hypothetical protein n=1 Tax=Nodularia sphaerocarpa TaxID=137816 RepID=UPI001EFB1D72|nr:hypothetical protein [Nodularia sphaerocarpa]MDB9373103.1 hypothetical protein [Nodularia sphaerocarpa CS-585]ULP73233.1 hypothetical protein BDGGKGIB_02886 [Nodularia sphaerocarpa UHCC 0038]
MLENNRSNNSFLFQSLSEKEQESLSGGLAEGMLGSSNFLFQKTDIQTEADNNLNPADDESSSQSSKYNLSQITMASSITFRFPTFSGNSNILNNLIPQITSGLIS